MAEALFDVPGGASPVTAGAPDAAAGRRDGDRGRPLLTILVHGLPAPAGSKRAFRNPHSGRIQQVESSKRVKPWREAVKYAALDVIAAREGTGDPFTVIGGPVYVETTFTLPRPKGHYRTGRNAHLLRDGAPVAPAGKPDLEKLVRSTRDALTDAGVWTDDCLVVRELNAKAYPTDDGIDAMPWPGAVVRIYAFGDTD